MRWCVRPRPDQANQPVVFDDRPERKGYRHPSGGAGKLSAIIRSRARGSCHKGRQSRNSEVRLTHRWRKTDSNSRSLRAWKGYGEPLEASIAVSGLNL